MIGNPNANLPINREGKRDVSKNAYRTGSPTEVWLLTSVHPFPQETKKGSRGESVQHPKSNGWCSHLNGNMRRQFT